MNLSYDQMATFHAVARHGSFSKAAVSLFRSQSAVSIQVAKLEEALGRRLFDRTTKYFALTEAGEVLQRYVSEIEELMQQAEQELADLDHMEQGRLVLCTSDTTGCYRLPAMLRQYSERYPGIDIVVRNATSPRTIQAVYEHEVDLGIVTLASLKTGLETVPLFPRHDVLICHPQHALANRKKVRLKDLEDCPMILPDQNCSSRRIIDELCERAEVGLTITMELSSIEVIKRFVRIDAGLSIVPEISILEEVASGALATVEIGEFQEIPEHEVGVIYREGRYLTRAARSFLEELQAYIKESSGQES
ncbi:MAG: LysR family transcriptional regulator [Gemmatimonadota bacterium]|nr:LysR family transcriptional regulator [Gemmatimonadota bacterium]